MIFHYHHQNNVQQQTTFLFLRGLLLFVNISPHAFLSLASLSSIIVVSCSWLDKILLAGHVEIDFLVFIFLLLGLDGKQMVISVNILAAIPKCSCLFSL